MPKVIKSGVREVILKVKEFFIKEREHSKYSNPIIPFERVNERVAAATGVSLRTVTRIASERRLAEASSSKIVTTGKKRKIKKDKLLLDNVDIGVLQRKMQRKVAEVNIVKPSSAMPEMVQTSFKAISTDEWCNYCSHVKKLEEYRLKSGCINEDSDKRLLDVVHAEHNYSR